ncbi:hypothetical protein CEK26_003736 [Fusarium fujikuroi]|nr:hypothetical protein CEK27_003728 [Fusarium fujikuroi]QGJ02292.1 hypothetical protein CEK26_003736 [Fusarium fujikuroi]
MESFATYNFAIAGTLFVLVHQATAATLLEDGEDFTNNLVSDLAPLLTLFGERVTTQFMSQSTGWADSIALAMAPIGVITIIISAIRVAGPRMLKAVIGRARENVATAELEVMSSTSSEACELWNSKTQVVVRCPGNTDNCELICIYPTSMIRERNNRATLNVRILDIDHATGRGKKDHESTLGQQHPVYLENRSSARYPSEAMAPEIPPNTIIITRNKYHNAPNMTLNCTSDGESWQVVACAVFGCVLQAGVLLFFGFLTEYRTLQFDKDGTSVAGYSMPFAVAGTITLNIGIIICARAVDESSDEEVYEVRRKKDAALAMVWLQKQKSVSEQHFDPAAIYPSMRRHRAIVSKRVIGNDGKSLEPQPLTNSDRLKGISTVGTIVSVLGYIIQFIGLRGMHWLATMAQLAAVIVMTIFRAIIRRHLASGLNYRELDHSMGFELEWFISSLLDANGINWIPGDTTKDSNEEQMEQNRGNNGESQEESPHFTWLVRTGDVTLCRKLMSRGEERSGLQIFKDVFDLSIPQSVLDLRRHLGDLSRWQGPASDEALALAKAIEKVIEFFLPIIRQADTGSSWCEIAGDCERDTGGDATIEVKEAKTLEWIMAVDYCQGSQPATNNEVCASRNVKITFTKTPEGAWRVPIDEIDAALSLWLYSVKEKRREDRQDKNQEFPSRNDDWIRGQSIRQRCLQILGPSTPVLLRDLRWWMPNGLDGVLEAQEHRDPNVTNGNLLRVREERIGRSGERWQVSTTTDSKSTSDPSRVLPSQAHDSDSPNDGLTRWTWKSAADIHQERGDETAAQLGSKLVVETQDPLDKLYAKDMFSSFLWSMVDTMDKSRINSESWRSFTLQNHKLSLLVQSIAELGLWTERDVWLSLIPPLCATDNLPGLETVIQMAQDKAAKLERVFLLDKAGSSYRWLFDIGMQSLPTSHVRLKSTAILWRFQKRLLEYECPDTGAIYHTKGRGSQNELTKTSQRLKQEREREESESGTDTQDTFRKFFDIHQRLRGLEEELIDKRTSVKYRVVEIFEKVFKDRMVYESWKSSEDIFGRTKLHHAMQSGFIDFVRVVGLSGTTTWNPLVERETPYSDLEYYVTWCKKPQKEVLRFTRHPIYLPGDIYSAIICPFQTLQSVLENGEDPNAQDMDYCTPLHYACTTVLQGPESQIGDSYYGERDKLRIKALLLNKVDLNAQSLTGNTPLHCAVLSCRLDLVSFLLEQGSDAQIANSQGQTILHLAAKKHDVDMIEELIGIEGLMKAQDHVGWTPLHVAATHNRPQIIATFLKHNSNSEAQDHAGHTPLHLAIVSKKKDAIEALIDKKASTKWEGTRIETVLKLADDSGLLDFFEDLFHTNVISFLIFKAARNTDGQNNISRVMEDIGRHSWPPINNDKEDPITVAADHGNSEVIEKMIEKMVQWDFDPEKILTANDWGSALRKAIWRGHLGVVTTIVTNLGSSLPEVLQKLSDATGQNLEPIHFLAICINAKQLDILEFFICRGANIRTKDFRGQNLLHRAAATDPSMKLCEGVIERIARTEWSSHIEPMRQELDKEGKTYIDVGRYSRAILRRASKAPPF